MGGGNQPIGVGKRTGSSGAMGTTLLRGGHAGAAILSFRRQLEKDPDSVTAQVGLGRALAETGACVEALDWLSATRETLPFGEDAAIDAASCAARLGDLEEAVWYLDAALLDSPESPRVLTTKASLQAKLGDQPGLLRTLDLLTYAQPDGKDASLYARMVDAIDRGDVEEFDWIAWRWEWEGRSDRELRLLRAQLWLDLDDPWSAAREIEPRGRRGSHAARALRAEALRRMGSTGEALYALVDRNTKARQLRVDAVRARIEVDMGELDEAAATLQPYEGLVDTDVLASAWYLARARGEQERVRLLAGEHRARESSQLAHLGQLVPWPVRGEGG